MKSFLVFLRILIVGCLWGIVFTEGIRVIMLCNWHFDIFWPDHWRQFNQMWQAGWKPHAAKEWALILLIVTFIPMLITGWWTLSLVEWERIIWNIISYPFKLVERWLGKSPVTAVTTNNRYGVVKRKSYKQIRPAGISTLRVPISDYGNTAISAPISTPSASALAGSSYAPAYSSAAAATPVKKKTDVAATIDHALFKFDDDDDDFDLDIDSFEKADINKKKQTTAAKPKKKIEDDDDDFEKKSLKNAFDFDDDEDEEEEEEAPRAKRRETKEVKESKRGSKKTETSSRTKESDSDDRAEKPKRNNRSAADKAEKNADESGGTRGPVYDTLSQKGYDILTNVAVGNTMVDFVGISENDICVCLVDKESGDWLADEEMFNGEEPLWFSENSHRVSPVCKLNGIRKTIEEKLEEEGFEQHLSFYVIIQMANIINADDMFEIWDNMHIEVTRINRGAPKEIKLFSKQLSEASEKTTKKNVDKLRSIFKSMK